MILVTSAPLIKIALSSSDCCTHHSRLIVPSGNLLYSSFSHTHKVGNNGINANFVLPHSCSFLHYLYLKMLVSVKLDVSLQKGLPFNTADFIGLFLFWMAWPKQSFQYCHSCIVERSWKTLLTLDMLSPLIPKHTHTHTHTDTRWIQQHIYRNSSPVQCLEMNRCISHYFYLDLSIDE